jgi:hypothetical protein
MRDVFAGALALVLLFIAVSLATTLTWYRRRRRRTRQQQEGMGRRIIVELPAADDLVLVAEDADAIYYGAQAIPKDRMIAARVLINGSPIAEYVSSRHARDRHAGRAAGFQDRPEGIARDRWDVAVDLDDGVSVLIECGAIRERVSQELARAIYDAIRAAIERRDTGTLR